jgi:hypothetical protein
VKGPSRGTAPGSNGLRPELFKLGGDALANRLVKDFAVLWPTKRELETAAPSSPRVEILQQWQDADVVTLFKHKGDPTDPGNCRGIFLLDVAGKVLASVINRRLRRLIETPTSDVQCEFRENRSTSQLTQVKAYVVFIDFAKAIDSPPRAAIWECLEWSGCPPDLLAVIMAINTDPRGKLQGSNENECFQVTHGVRQGCVLGPTLFIIVLDYCLHLAGTESIDLQFRCVDKGGMPLSPDICNLVFTAGCCIFTDDVVLYGAEPGTRSPQRHLRFHRLGHIRQEEQMGVPSQSRSGSVGLLYAEQEAWAML